MDVGRKAIVRVVTIAIAHKRKSMGMAQGITGNKGVKGRTIISPQEA